MAPTTATRCTVRRPRTSRAGSCPGGRGPLSPLVLRPADEPALAVGPAAAELPAPDQPRTRAGAAALERAGGRGPSASAVVRWEQEGRAPARRSSGDAGMATAEYAIATLAACGFAGLLLAILASDQVRGLLLGIVQRALSVG